MAGTGAHGGGTDDRRPARRRGWSGSAALPAAVTGFGLGGFADGILFHQLLQWHHLASGYRSAEDRAGLVENTSWDGAFHAAVWLVVTGGLVWLWARRDAARSVGLGGLVGALLVGWGVFHVVDQVVFHLLLDAHHIRMVEDYQVYDWSYTGVGVLLALAGAWLLRRDVPGQPGGRSDPPSPTPRQ